MLQAREHLEVLEEDLSSQSSVGQSGLVSWREEERAWSVNVLDRANWATLRSPYHLDEQYREYYRWSLMRMCSYASGPAAQDIHDAFADTSAIPLALAEGLADVIHAGIALEERRYGALDHSLQRPDIH